MAILGQDPGFWMGLLAIVSLLVMAGNIVLAFLLLRLRGEFPTRKDIAPLVKQQGELRERLVVAEARLATVPSDRELLHAMAIGIEGVRGDLKAMAARLNGIDDLLTAQRRQVELMDEYMRARP